MLYIQQRGGLYVACGLTEEGLKVAKAFLFGIVEVVKSADGLFTVKAIGKKGA